MRTTADAVVVGGGGVGASILCQLAALGLRTAVLCERRQPAAGATGRSGTFIQLYFADTEPEARLALASLPFFQRWAELVGAGSCGFVQRGYVRLEPPARSDHLRAHVRLLQGIGVRTSVVSPAEVRELAPYLHVDDVGAAAYEPEAGHADARATVAGFLERACREGAEVYPGTTVVRIRTRGGRVIGVETTRGPIDAPLVVVAAGVWSPPLLESVGLALPLRGAWTQTAIFAWPEGCAVPLINVGDGVHCSYFRSLGAAEQHILVGLTGGVRRPLGDPDRPGDRVDADYAQQAADRLERRLPDAAGARLVGGAGGPITLTPDDQPIIDRHPGLDGLFLFAGDCGGSFKTAPAVGRALAEWAVLGAPRIVDLAPFAAARFAQGAGGPPGRLTDYHRLSEGAAPAAADRRHSSS